ncbi:MAG: hypothetical protein M3539_18705 [Acidobacteriota bacterium]|nr:hypothetical protein [Acidobacteriota bacterium]
MLRSFSVFARFLALVAIVVSFSFVSVPAQGQTTPSREAQARIDKNAKNFTAEQIAESAIYIYGTRPLLLQIRRNGVERGRICKPTCEVPGKTEEASYERRFVRGESSEKDKVRVDQKMPSLEYSLIYGDGRLWGIINGASFTPRQDAATTFLSQHRHSLDNLLRYKEDGSTLTLVGKDKQKGLDLYILDVISKDKQKTRYYISSKTLRVAWLEYEDSIGGATPVKFKRTFHDYRYAQGTLVPYRTVLLQEGNQMQETRILTVTYGIKLDDSLFKSPEA